MPQSQGNRYPDMPVQKRLVGRPWRRIVMDIGPFDSRPIPFGGRIVDHQQQPIGQRQGPQQEQYELRCDRFALASNTGQEVILMLAEVVRR